MPFAETRDFLKEFPLAASERCDRDFQCDLLRSHPLGNRRITEPIYEQGPVLRRLADSQVRSQFMSQGNSRGQGLLQSKLN